MRTLGRIITVAAVIVFLLECWRLGQLQRSGPPHFELILKGGIPATMYLPPGSPGLSSPWPLPPAQRPPVAILIHGFASDRSIVSTLARRLAQNGIAVLAIDLRGHGANRNPVVENPISAGALDYDVKAAVEYARTSALVDGSRVIVMGHSMGAGAALDYSGEDPALAGAVMISGGWHLFGAVRPRNTLFIVAARDPKQIARPVMAIASHLAGVPNLKPGVTYGDFKSGTATRAVQVPGTDHITIVFSSVAAREIIQWCDQAFRMTPPGPLRLRDPRLRVYWIMSIAFVIVLFAIGHAVGSLAPSRERRPAEGGWLGLLGLIVALVVTMPLVSTEQPASFLSLVVGEVIISWFALTGAVILGALALLGRLDWLRLCDHGAATCLSSLLGFVVIYALQVPGGVVFHRMNLTPERLVAAGIATLLLIPFFLGFEALVRRGGLLASVGLGVLGRAIILAALWAGIALEVVPFVVALILPSLIIQFILFEIFAGAVYARSGNIAAVALVESAWLGWIVAVTMPITFML
jgi:pimeloyl-ACP methyl ester carboxylesterase